MANIIIISVEKRKTSAVPVQKLLTQAGCIIKTRLGIHDSPGDTCSDKGLIIIEVVACAKEIKSLFSSIKSVRGVKAKLVKI
ncbi:hypothetical protein [Endomicrobium proavitum]|uniref:Uncharacterized protein n=1 Tax=Endomicrobium proavitum TaxID=1408281 RepID=A0A0G3WIV3_9BACT|nr:hypothetical protein [Endomicrobium proavitum]AKL97424.1 hypothetical protein Epro_0045 [Endomicrobium proavitum]